MIEAELHALSLSEINQARAGGVLAVLFREELPMCDLCGGDMIDKLHAGKPRVDKPAAFDAHHIGGSWANMCPLCYIEQGSPDLGIGYGQRLILTSVVQAIEEREGPPEEMERPSDGVCLSTDDYPVELDGHCQSTTVSHRGHFTLD